MDREKEQEREEKEKVQKENTMLDSVSLEGERAKWHGQVYKGRRMERINSAEE